ncbi:MAG: hypothetical protein LBB24_01935 [Rickettsiales bacterium]|jgi:predicted RNase H-like nuclease (RuvC/YqgF family)|nr:hypothetical protein [Rickettsiales bacterium]
MAENPKKNKLIGSRGFLLLAAALTMLLLDIFLLSVNRKNAALRDSMAEKYENFNRIINDISEKNELLRREVASLRNKMEEILSNSESVEKKLEKLESRTAEGQDKNIRILMNLNRIQKALENGDNFSEQVRSLEQLCASDDRLESMVIGLREYEDSDLSQGRIESTFNGERARIGEKITMAESGANRWGKLMKFLGENIRIIRSSGSHGADGIRDSMDMAARNIARHDYKALVDMLGQEDKFSEVFRETLKIARRRVELNKLVDNLFGAIYYYSR